MPTLAKDEIPGRRGDEAEVVSHAMPEAEAEKVAIVEWRQRVRRFIDRPWAYQGRAVEFPAVQGT